MGVDTRNLLAGLRRLEKSELSEAFDPFILKSRPNQRQKQILEDINSVQYRYVVAGNQCKPAYSLVKMADGTEKPISLLEIGDWVMGFDKKLQKLIPVQVVRTWKNGEKDVYRYYTSPHQYTDSTSNHEMLRYLGGKLVKTPIEKCKELVTSVYEYEA